MTLSSLNNCFFFSRFRLILLGTCLLGLTSYSYAQEIIVPKIGSELRKNLLDTVRVKAEQELQTKILFMVDEFRTDGRWAFLSAIPVTSSFTEIDYAKTKYAQQYKLGLFDNVVVALLFKEGEVKWSIIEFSMGSTDASFVDWPEKYGVPKLVVISE